MTRNAHVRSSLILPSEHPLPMKYGTAWILLLFATSAGYAQDHTNVKLLEPENGAIGVQDPGYNPNNGLRITFRWSSVDGADAYEMWFVGPQCGVHSGDHSGSAPYDGWLPIVTTYSDTMAVSGTDYGGAFTCGMEHNGTYIWKVRAVVDDSARQWSELRSFTTSDFQYPNEKDQQLLDYVGWVKPTVWDSTHFHTTADIDQDYLNLTKEIYKASGDLIGHTTYHVYVFGPDPSLWGPVLEINNRNCEQAGHYCTGQPHYDGIARGNTVFEQGPYPNLGIGHQWNDGSPEQVYNARKPLGDAESMIADAHEITHVFEGTRVMSAWSKYPMWYRHLTSDGGFAYPFIRDYASPIQATYVDIDFAAMDSLGNVYTTKTWDEDNVRYASYGIVSGEYDDLSKHSRDSLIVNGQVAYGGWLSGHYLAYLTSPQRVYIDQYDDRAWTKPFEQMFEDAYGMTLTEFSRRFYDWLSTADPLTWTYILPKEHSTELFHYPKRFDTTVPAEGAEAIGRRPEFRWKPSTDFSSYQIQISHTEDFADPLHTMHVEGAASVYQDEVTAATLDTVLEANTTYFWRMRSILGVNQSDWTAPGRFTTGTRVSSEQDALPFSFNLAQNYPNPFNPRTTIAFTLPEAQRVRLDVHNLLGQRVATLIDKRMNPGHHSIGFHAADLASGMYLYRLTGAVSGEQTRTMYLIK